MGIASTSDVVVLSLGVVLAGLYLFREQIFSSSKPKTSIPVGPKGGANGFANSRDFVEKLKAGVRTHGITYTLTLMPYYPLCRRSALSYSTDLKREQQRSTPSV